MLMEMHQLAMSLKHFKNPGKLINITKKVGKSLDEKLKSGEIKESELMEEASDFLKNE